MIRIVIGGDICPMGTVHKAFVDGNAGEIFHDLSDEIASADLAIANLECPLVTRETPIEKPGGALLAASVNAIYGFKSAKWHVLNLANNHSFDHGTSGLQDTIKAIEDAGLRYIGAGANLKEAGKPFIKEIDGQRIVIYAMAEREYSVADKTTAGANPLDIINFVETIRSYKQDGLFIVLIHGGKEYFPYPSPEMVRRCRFMVDMGADAVVCCHTHGPLPWEIYSERPIVYGMGNLIFESDGEPASWYEGYLVRLVIENRRLKLETHPYFQSKGKPGVQKMDETSKTEFHREMEKKLLHVQDSAFLQGQWDAYCAEQKDVYLAMLFGYRKPMRKMKSILLPLLQSKEEIHRALLLAQCETHREILDTIFKSERRGI